MKNAQKKLEWKQVEAREEPSPNTFIEKLHPGQEPDEGEGFESSSLSASGSSASGSSSQSQSSPYNVTGSDSSSGSDTSDSSSGSHSYSSSNSSPYRAELGSSSSSEEHKMRHMMHMHRKNRKHKFPHGQRPDSDPTDHHTPIPFPDEGLKSGIIKNVIQDTRLNTFVAVIQSGKEEINAIVTDDTLVLFGERRVEADALGPNKSVNFLIGKKHEAIQIRITGGSTEEIVVEFDGDNLIGEGLLKKKSSTI